jgi:putative oxidoreductase
MSRLDVASLILRVALGLCMFLHGANKWRSPASRAGTAGWFASIGMRHAKIQAAMAAFTEMGAGIFLAVGLFVPSASGAIIATMVVAIVVAHRRSGFFIFNEGQGWEYCAMLSVVAIAIAGLGGGRVSLDNALGIDYGGTWGFVTGLTLGLCGAALHLLASYRPGASRQASGAA